MAGQAPTRFRPPAESASARGCAKSPESRFAFPLEARIARLQSTLVPLLYQSAQALRDRSPPARLFTQSGELFGDPHLLPGMLHLSAHRSRRTIRTPAQGGPGFNPAGMEPYRVAHNGQLATTERHQYSRAFWRDGETTDPPHRIAPPNENRLHRQRIQLASRDYRQAVRRRTGLAISGDVGYVGSMVRASSAE